MSDNKCKLCYKIFNSKTDLIRHENKKNKCNKETENQCGNCNKYFKSKYYLQAHLKNCHIETNEIELDNCTKEAIKSILLSDDNDEIKISLITNYDNINLTNESVKLLLNSKMNLEGKINYIYSKIKIINDQNNAIINNTISNSNNNNTTNIQINQFGKEDISYLDSEYFKKILNVDKNLENSLITLTKDIHLRLDHPENRNIKVTNLNNKYATIYSNGKWRGITKESLKEELHKKNIKLIKIHYNQLKDVLNDKHKNNIKILLGRDADEDPVLKEINDKIILLFYSKED